MTKTVLKIALAAALLGGVPMQMRANQSIEVIENDFQDITISVVGSTLHITGANGENLQIFNVAGVRVMSIKVEGADKRYELNLPKGCYIIKVGKTVRKFSIK